MPIGPTHTKAQKQKVVHTEMHKFKEGELHSGSKHGPKVKSRAQAIAIALHESGQSKKHARSGSESKPGYDRSGHWPGNPGFPNKMKGTEMSMKEVAMTGPKDRGSELEGKGPGMANHDQPQGKSIGAGHPTGKAEHHPHMKMDAHSFKMPAGNNAHTFCGTQKSGAHRVSGHPGAHQIGKKK